MGRMYVIGDSHAIIFGGRHLFESQKGSIFHRVKTVHLGPALAYNLMGDKASLGKWGNAVDKIVKKNISDILGVILCFGEIDIRAHIPLVAINEEISLMESVHRVAKRHFKYGLHLSRLLNKPVFLWGPFGTGKNFLSLNLQYPRCGTEEERNLATILYNEILERYCRSVTNLYYFSIHQDVISPALVTDGKCLEDNCHLSFHGFSLMRKRFNSIVEDNSLDIPDIFNLGETYEGGSFELVDGTEQTQKTVQCENKRGDREGQQIQTILYDFGCISVLGEILVEMHNDAPHSLQVGVGVAIGSLSMLGGVDDTALQKGRVRLSLGKVKAQFVAIMISPPLAPEDVHCRIFKYGIPALSPG